MKFVSKKSILAIQHALASFHGRRISLVYHSMYVQGTRSSLSFEKFSACCLLTLRNEFNKQTCVIIDDVCTWRNLYKINNKYDDRIFGVPNKFVKFFIKTRRV